MATKRYDAAQVTIVVCGILIDSGFDDGEFLSIEQAEAIYTKKVGADGEVTRSRTNDNSATCTITLMSTSDSNTYLGALTNAGILAKNGADIGAFLVRDRVSGVCMYAADKCWVAAWPQVTYDKDATKRAWKIDVSNLLRVDAGS